MSRATAWVGAVTVGVGIAMGGAAVASAEPSERGSAASQTPSESGRPDSPAAPRKKTARTGLGQSVAPGARARPASAARRSALARSAATPATGPRARPAEPPASAAASPTSTVPAAQSAAAVPADPVGAALSALAALFNNQTPGLEPTQTAVGPDGVVSGQLNAVDPDSPRLSYTITGQPASGSAMLDPGGGWTYIPDHAAIAAGLTDSFRVTVSDAPSGFAIHGLAGLLHLLSFGLIGARGDTGTATVTVTIAAVPGPDPAIPVTGDYALIPRTELMSKPTSGAGWEFLKSQADGAWEPPDLSAPNTKNPGRVLAAALVYARTGDVAYRDRVIAAVRELPGTEDGADIVLPLARNLFGYVMAADLVRMPPDTVTANGQTWQAFLQEARQLEFPGNTRWLTLEKTAGDSAGNWNAYALSSHLAVSVVLGDQAAVERDITIYRRFLGDTASPWPAFKPTSGYVWNNNGQTWDMTPTLQRGINPDVPGDRRSGAIVIDVSRHTVAPSVPCCTVDLAGRTYTEESLDALLAINMVLKARGSDFTEFEDQALRRAYEFLLANGGPSGYSNGRYLALAIDAWYGTSHATVEGDSIARHLGFGGWLF